MATKLAILLLALAVAVSIVSCEEATENPDNEPTTPATGEAEEEDGIEGRTFRGRWRARCHGRWRRKNKYGRRCGPGGDGLPGYLGNPAYVRGPGVIGDPSAVGGPIIPSGLVGKPSLVGKPGIIGGPGVVGSGYVQGYNQAGFNKQAEGFNQGSGAFATGNQNTKIVGFRQTEGYRTVEGFEDTSFNRYGTGASGFQGSFNQQSAGKFNEQGQQGGFVSGVGRRR